MTSPLAFWVGTWDVHDSATGERAGSNEIVSILDGHGVLERWRGASGLEGTSLFWNDGARGRGSRSGQRASAGRSRRRWSPPTRRVPFVSRGSSRCRTAAQVRDRTTLTPLGDGSVRQVIETAPLDGDAWEVGFDAVYTPALSPFALPIPGRDERRLPRRARRLRRRCTFTRKEIRSMSKRQVLPALLLVVGAAMLAAAVGVGAAGSATNRVTVGHALKGGTLKVNQANADFDYVDPQLAYRTDDWDHAVPDVDAARQLPGEGGRGGQPALSAGGDRIPERLERRQDVHVPHPAGPQVLGRVAADGGGVPARVGADPQPEDGLAARCEPRPPARRSPEARRSSKGRRSTSPASPRRGTRSRSAS